MRKAFLRQSLTYRFAALVFTPFLVGFDVGLLAGYLV